MEYFASVCAGLLAGALLGAGIGYLAQLPLGQAGWWLVGGSLGACLGAFWAGLRRADGELLWSRRGPARPGASEAELAP